MKKTFLSFLLAISLVSCDLFPDGIDNVAGLKEALKVGTSSAALTLGAKDGYFLDDAVKIILPKQAETALNAIKTIQSLASIPIIGDIISEAGLNLASNFDGILIEAINRAAEDAAPAAVNVFVDAITKMSINDATNILFSSGERKDFAATDYLKANTLLGLTSAFSPIINESLGKVSVGGYTALDAWNLFATQNNNLANVIENVRTGFLTGLAFNLLPEQTKNTLNSIKHIDDNLGDYVTGKALDGLFLKVGDQEQKIRTEVSARTNKLLQDVFGQLDK